MKKNDILDGNTLCKTIRDYLKIYLPKQRNYSEHTIRSYQHTLDMLMDFLKEKNHVSLDKVTFEMLTAEAINEYIDYIETERGCTIATRNNRLAIVRAFLVYASERDVTTIFNLDELKRKVPVKKTDAVCVIDYMSIAAVSAKPRKPIRLRKRGCATACLL